MMKKNNKLLTLLVFILLLFLVSGAVSANSSNDTLSDSVNSDLTLLNSVEEDESISYDMGEENINDNTDDITSQVDDDGDIDSVNLIDNSNINDFKNLSHNDNEILKRIEVNNFDDLKSCIENAESDEIIILTQDIAISSHKIQTITIKSNLTIEGNSYSIFAEKHTRVFKITSDAYVCIKNLTINGAAPTGYNANSNPFGAENPKSDVQMGSAIYVDNGIVNIINCKFTSNQGNTVYIGDMSNFNQENKFQGSGAGIYVNSGVVSISSCEFSLNTAEKGGGIYVNSGHVTVIDSNFTSNEADVGSGMYVNDASVDIIGSTFESNCGGNFAINVRGSGLYVNNGNINILNSKFKSNHGDNFFSISEGGGIYINNGNVNIVSSEFSQNCAQYGGGIYVNNGNVNITYSLFDSNYICSHIMEINSSLLVGYGAGILTSFSNDKLIVNNTRFINNTIQAGSGSAINIKRDNTIINNSTFEDNKINAVSVYSSNVTIYNCNFNNSGSNVVIAGDNSIINNTNITYGSDKGIIITGNNAIIFNTNVIGNGEGINNKGNNTHVYYSKIQGINNIPTIELGSFESHWKYGNSVKIPYNLTGYTSDMIFSVWVNDVDVKVSNDTQMIIIDCLNASDTPYDLYVNVYDNNIYILNSVQFYVVGDVNLTNHTNASKVVFNKSSVNVFAKNKVFNKKLKTKLYPVVLKSKNGKVLKNAFVTLKIKGKLFKAKTNSKGKAIFKITKLTKKGKYKATIAYKGNNCYNKASKKVKLVLK